MTIAFNAIQEAQAGFSAVFACVAAGFAILKLLFRDLRGPGFWAASFAANSLGFLLWSGLIPVPPLWYYLAGEIAHVAGFFLLVLGSFAFCRLSPPRAVAAAFGAAWFLVWGLSILLLQAHPLPAGIVLKLARASLFCLAGFVLVRDAGARRAVGQGIAGGSLLLWGSYIALSAVVRLNQLAFYGFLVGLQILAAFGMVAMLVDSVRGQRDEAERRVRRLEGILPICSYCKKIRDDKDEWQVLEAYIEDRSKAEFSHGICPECFAKHRPDR